MNDARPGIFIALGSNLGDRAATLRAALDALTSEGDIRLVRCSTLHETEPVGGPPGQPRYLNAAAELETEIGPRRLLERMLAIEARFGRQRGERNGPRTLDLDLLLYGAMRIDEPGLVVPHPRMWERSFVLTPLREIAGAGVSGVHVAGESGGGAASSRSGAAAV